MVPSALGGDLQGAAGLGVGELGRGRTREDVADDGFAGGALAAPLGQAGDWSDRPTQLEVSRPAVGLALVDELVDVDVAARVNESARCRAVASGNLAD